LTNFHHQPRSGKRKKGKSKPFVSLEINGDPERLLVHREMEYLRAAAGNNLKRKIERREKLKAAEGYNRRSKRHKVEVGRYRRSGWEAYGARCSCGWESDLLMNLEAVQEAARLHSDNPSRTT
jgi:hypothetical protein